MKESKTITIQRNWIDKLLVCGLALLPIVASGLLIGFKLARKIATIPIYFLMALLPFWAGYRWYRLFSIDKGYEKSTEGDSWVARPDVFVLVTAIVFGFGVGLLMRELFTHEMVRAFTDTFVKDTDED